jgi:hypothetical protein
MPDLRAHPFVISKNRLIINEIWDRSSQWPVLYGQEWT